MGIVELDHSQRQLLISAHIITYGSAADPTITRQICEEIESMWNEPGVPVRLGGQEWKPRFRITGEHVPATEPIDIYQNTDPRINYFRIETFVRGNISFVDDIGSNTGYFLRDNLYPGSTTAAHEFGHTLGLVHPHDLDFRGKGVPGIMYPRGTLVDPVYQYNPEARAGDSSNGGTMHPKFRKVRAEDIALLELHKLDFENGQSRIGEFTSVWHPNHAELG